MQLLAQVLATVVAAGIVETGRRRRRDGGGGDGWAFLAVHTERGVTDGSSSERRLGLGVADRLGVGMVGIDG